MSETNPFLSRWKVRNLLIKKSKFLSFLLDSWSVDETREYADYISYRRWPLKKAVFWIWHLAASNGEAPVLEILGIF